MLLAELLEDEEHSASSLELEDDAEELIADDEELDCCAYFAINNFYERNIKM